MLTDIFWAKYFKVYDLLNEAEPYRQLIGTINDFIPDRPNGIRVFDAGCGTGNLLLYIYSKRKIIEGIGIDFSNVAINIAKMKQDKAKAKSLRFVLGNLNDPLKFHSNYFDVVVMNNVLYTVEPNKRHALLREIYRILAPNGKFVVADIHFGFKPTTIYKSHIKYLLKTKGFIYTFFQLLKFIYPTAMIFYYNSLIKRNNKLGAYRFINAGEHKEIMTSVGFKMMSSDKHVYANNSYLSVGIK